MGGEVEIHISIFFSCLLLKLLACQERSALSLNPSVRTDVVFWKG